MLILENSCTSVLDFAFQAAGGDGIVSSQELSSLAKNSKNLIGIIEKLDTFSHLNEDFYISEKESLEMYLLNISNEEIEFSKYNFEKSAERITAITLQPAALALAVHVASSDGLDEKESKLIETQKELWGCDKSDLDYYLAKLT